VEGETLLTDIRPHEIAKLDRIERDEWPAR
jgi:hypothetical protein